MEPNPNETMQPTRTELVVLWMTLYHSNEQAVVFFDPVGDGDRVAIIEERLSLNEAQIVKLICCDVYIHPMPIAFEDLCAFVNQMDQEVYGFITAWDGNSFVTHN